MNRATPLLSVQGLHKSYAGQQGRHWALRDLSFELPAGRSLALVGESGSGKTTAALCLAGLLVPDSGSVHLNGHPLVGASTRSLRGLRRHIGLVLQNPLTSMSPRRRLWQSVAEPLRVHEPALGRDACREQALQGLLRVGLDASLAERLPHQLSGGQLQRAAIARAVVLRPALVVLDEPTSALDVSVQAQMLNLLCDLRDEFGLSYVFITHNLAIVEMVADEVLVMHQGQAVERGAAARVFSAPEHPYTRELLGAIPDPDPATRPALQGDQSLSLTEAPHP
jgi:ABC-type glutathione transport system ATPase component